MSTRFAAVVAASLLAVGCGGGSDSGSAETSDAPAATPAATAQAAGLDGEALFQEKTCNVCHAFGSRMVGPDLAGVTDRRSKDWILAMMLKTDSMLANDSVAMALLDEYGTPMLPAPMSQEEAEAIYAHLVGK